MEGSYPQYFVGAALNLTSPSLLDALACCQRDLEGVSADGLDRRGDRPPSRPVGRGALDRGNRPPAEHHEECRRWKSSPAQPSSQAITDPSYGRGGARAAPRGAAPGQRPHAADPGCHGFARSPAGAAPVATRPSRCPTHTARHWPGIGVLLADRRAWHAELPFLQRWRHRRQAILRRPQRDCLREGPGPAGRRCLIFPRPAQICARDWQYRSDGLDWGACQA